MTGLMQIACNRKGWCIRQSTGLHADNNPGENVICTSHGIERRNIMSGYAMENGDKLWPAFPNPLPP